MSDTDRNQDDIDATSGGSDDSTGGEQDGGAGGTGSSDSSEKLREAEARARSFQSEADKARKQIAELEARLKGKDESGDETPAPTGLTEEQVRQVMRREAARTRELADAVETAKAEYPNADPSTLVADKYESAEEMLEAVKASHETLTAHIDARVKAEEERVRKLYAEKYGELPAPPDPKQGDGGGDPTLAQLSAMSIPQLEELERRSPGVIERVQRSADQLN